MTTPRIERERAEVAEEGAKHLQDDWTVTVCDACLCACCWQGEFYCDDYKTAGTKDITIGEARALNRESATFWTKDVAVSLKLLAIGVYA